ncbi:uncharacterized protein PG998_014419 [Apiospora kogelbergensis]|uniref:uncharacterized protein n=1 Tax=Apiospora kogelbergensis TaxID=1337665 RepID=UPI00312ECB1D
MASYSLANRTKVVPSSYLEDFLNSYEPSGEDPYTSQGDLALNTPPAADVGHFVLPPEPDREEVNKEPKQSPQRQPSDTMVGQKSSAISSGELATPPPQEAKKKKKKYTRAFSHRARTGCMTW